MPRREGMKWSSKCDDAHESRTGWKIRRSEISEKGKSGCSLHSF